MNDADDKPGLGRRMVIRFGVAVALSPVLGAAGCDGDTGGSDAGHDSGSPPAGDAGELSACGTQIMGNHGHQMEVTVAEVGAGAAVTYMIQGVSAHQHAVMVSAADFARLAGGESIAIRSSEATDGHDHLVTITCS